MTLRNKIKQTLREYNLDPTYGKRPDMLVSKLEKLFLQESAHQNISYGHSGVSVPTSLSDNIFRLKQRQPKARTVRAKTLI